MGKGPGPQTSGKAGLSIQTRGRRVRPASLEGQPLGAGLRGSTSLPGGTRPKGAGRVFRPAGTAGLSLRERDSMIGSAGPAGLNLRAPVTTSLPGGTDPPWGGAAWVDHLARWDRSEASPHLGAGLDWGAGPVRPPRRLPPLPDASWVAFCRRRRRLRLYRGGDGRGGGSSLWPGRARPPARPPSRRRLRGNSVACQSPSRRGPRAQGLLSQFPYGCRGRAVEAGSSEADVVCRDGIGAPAGR